MSPGIAQHDAAWRRPVAVVPKACPRVRALADHGCADWPLARPHAGSSAPARGSTHCCTLHRHDPAVPAVATCARLAQRPGIEAIDRSVSPATWRVLEKGYEGMVAKNETSAYVAGKTSRWLKVKVPGWTDSEDRWKRGKLYWEGRGLAKDQDKARKLEAAAARAISTQWRDWRTSPRAKRRGAGGRHWSRPSSSSAPSPSWTPPGGPIEGSHGSRPMPSASLPPRPPIFRFADAGRGALRANCQRARAESSDGTVTMSRLGASPRPNQIGMRIGCSRATSCRCVANPFAAGSILRETVP
jgi:hypothetical protein